MTTYTPIHGQQILIVASDPANPTVGQIWFNTTTSTLKGRTNAATVTFTAS